MVEKLASLAIPVVVCIVGLLMLFGKKPYFDSFVTGARDGLEIAVRLLPTLAALMVGITMLKASGVLDAIATLVSPAAEAVGVPPGLVPLLLTRPFSGSASTAAYSSLLEEYGADSYTGMCASVIMGSSDTMVYVITVYFSSVGIKKGRYAIPCAVAVMILCIFLSCLLTRLICL